MCGLLGGLTIVCAVTYRVETIGLIYCCDGEEPRQGSSADGESEEQSRYASCSSKDFVRRELDTN